MQCVLTWKQIFLVRNTFALIVHLCNTTGNSYMRLFKNLVVIVVVFLSLAGVRALGSNSLFKLNPKKTMSQDEVTAVFERQMSGYPKSQSRWLAGHILKLSKKHQFDPAFLLALIYVESSFRVRVISNKGAVGLMQLLPTTAEYVAKKWHIPYYGDSDLMNPIMNMTIGVRYLAFLRDKFKNNLGLFWQLIMLDRLE